MDKLLYINTVPDIRIKEMVDYAEYNTNAYKDKYLTFTALEDSIPSGWTIETANN